MKTTSVLFLCLAFVQLVTAQSRFQRAIGTSSDERNYHIATTQGGNLIATGYTDGISGNGDDAFLVKYNNLGGVEWAQTYGSTGDDYSWDVICTRNSDIVGVGYTSSFGTPNNAATITRTDSNGNVLWLTGLYNLSYGIDFYRVIETSSGHLLATGLMQSASKKDEMVLAKFTSKGYFIWAKTIGGSENDEAMGLIETASGHYLLAGLSEDTTGNGGSDFAVVKTDTAGRVIWSKLYGGSKNERLNAVVENRRWFYFVGWSSSIGSGEDDAVLMRTDTSGRIISVNAYGSTRDERCFNVLVDDNNHLILGGYTEKFSATGKNDNRNSFLMQINLFNQRIGWTQTYGGSKRDGHWPTGLAQTWRDRGFYVMGSSESYGAGKYDMYLMKADTGGIVGCNTRVGNFSRTTDTTWVAKDFGTWAKPSITSASSTLSGSKWTLKESVECCELYLADLKSDTICPFDNMRSAARQIPNYTYKWFKDGSTVANGSKIEIESGEGGDYSLQVSTTVAGCKTRTRNFTIHDDIAPKIFPDSAKACTGSLVRMELKGEYIANDWYSTRTKLKIDTGKFASQFVFYVDTIVSVSTTKKGCLHYDQLLLEVLEYPTLTLRDTFFYCEGDSILLTASSTHDYYWDGDTTTRNSDVWTKGTRYVVVESSNEFCIRRDSTFVLERDNPHPRLGADTVVCGDDSVCFVIPERADRAYWNGSRTPFDTFCTIRDTFVSVTVYDGWGCEASDSIHIERVDPNKEVFGVDTIFAQDSTQLNVSFGTSYFWTGAQLSNDTIANPWVSANGWYTVFVGDTSSPCIYTDSVYVDFGTGHGPAPERNRFELYPVPASHFCRISADSYLRKVSFFDVNGRVVQEHLVGENQSSVQIDVELMHSGTYLVEVVLSDGEVLRQLLLKD